MGFAVVLWRLAAYEPHELIARYYEAPCELGERDVDTTVECRHCAVGAAVPGVRRWGGTDPIDVVVLGKLRGELDTELATMGVTLGELHELQRANDNFVSNAYTDVSEAFRGAKADGKWLLVARQLDRVRRYWFVVCWLRARVDTSGCVHARKQFDELGVGGVTGVFEMCTKCGERF